MVSKERGIKLYHFYSYVKKRVLTNYFGFFLCKRIIKFSRLFGYEKLVNAIFLKTQPRKIFFTSHIAYYLISDNLSLSRSILKKIEAKAQRRSDSRVLYRLGVIYVAQNRYVEASTVLLRSLVLDISREKSDQTIRRTLLKLLQADRVTEHKVFFEYINDGKLRLSDQNFRLVQCEYAQLFDDYDFDWSGTLADACPKQGAEMDVVLANMLVITALGHRRLDIIDSIKDTAIVEFRNCTKSSRQTAIRRTLTMVSAAYYRSGDMKRIQSLGEEIEFDQLDWKIYQSFGAGDILSALNYRGEQILKTFLMTYPIKNRGKRRVASLEKDLCGEAFNALFYDAMISFGEQFSIICDERLVNILRRSFPTLAFIPKTPRNQRASAPDKFDLLTVQQSNFLDNTSYKKSKKHLFVAIDYKKYFFDEAVSRGRIEGWLKADPLLKKKWAGIFGGNKSLIGFSANSTLRSRIRDMHMVDLSYWGPIFNIPNLKFVNLNPDLDDAEVERLSKLFGADIINPDVDLYNDFDNLLAIISVMDFTIMPANNLMDFAAALGRPTAVFSPSSIMRCWAVEDDRYLFSKQVKFVFPGYTGQSIGDLVQKGAAHIVQVLDGRSLN